MKREEIKKEFDRLKALPKTEEIKKQMDNLNKEWVCSFMDYKEPKYKEN